MAETTIEWTRGPNGEKGFTFNPWEGCQKVGPGCDHCYAETRNARFAGGQAVNWGPGAPRRRTSASNWQQPIKWNAEAERLGIRYRVFCASLADVFDNEAPAEWRADLFDLIAKTPNLDWLLLTKRIGNVGNMLPVPFDFDKHYPNVWIGATIVNQAEADRDLPKLERVPAARRFVSIEPLLGPIDLQLMQYHDSDHRDEAGRIIANTRRRWLRWVIVGGESGPGARPMHPDWARSLRDQCKAAGVPFLFKQWGEWTEIDTGMPQPLVAHFGDPEWRDAAVAHDGFLSLDGHFTDNPDLMNDDVAYRGLVRLGKKAAGRLLDGRTWDEVPA